MRAIDDEFSHQPHRRYALSMAKWEAPNSAKSSFSIVLGRAPHLDGKYTVFGEVIAGFDVVARIEAVPVKGTAPTKRLWVRKVVVIPNPGRR